jgi:hypothetical protein
MTKTPVSDGTLDFTASFSQQKLLPFNPRLTFQPKEQALRELIQLAHGMNPSSI